MRVAAQILGLHQMRLGVDVPPDPREPDWDVLSLPPSTAGTAVTDAPSAHASTIRDRSPKTCAVLGRRNHPQDLPLPDTQHQRLNLRARHIR